MKRIVFILLATCLVYCNKDKDEPEEEKPVYLSRPTVFLGSKDQVYAIDADSGKLIWKQNASFNGSMSRHPTPTYSNGRMYLVQGSFTKENLTAYDATTGTIQWNTFIEYGNNPTAKYGNVYLTNYWSDTYSIDGKTGTINWVTRKSRRSVINSITGSPTVKDSMLYTGDYYTTLYAVNAFTGTNGGWNYGNTAHGPQLNYRPVVDNGFVYFRTDGSLVALNRADGSKKWEAGFKYSSWDYPSSPVLVNGALYVVADGTLLCSYDAATGNKNWEYKHPDWGVIRTSPVVWNNLAFIASDGLNTPSYVYAIDIATGQQVWKYQNSKIFSASPAVYNGNIYIGNADGLHVIDAASGQLKWKFTPDNNEPVVTNVCIVDTKNKIHTVSTSGDFE